MAREVIFSKRAQEDLKNILAFWIARNQSNTYSLKLYKLFMQATDVMKQFPRIGKLASHNTRIYIVRAYQIIYEILGNQILILIIWDSRRNLEDLEQILKE